MSFILEALRRADRDRKSGDNPDLATVIESPPARSTRKRAPWLAATAIVVLGIGMAGSLLWPEGERQPAPDVAAVPAPATPAAAPVVPPKPPPAPAVPTAAARAPGPVQLPATKSMSAGPTPVGTIESAGITLDGSLGEAVRRRRERAEAPRGPTHRNEEEPSATTRPDTEIRTVEAPPAPVEERPNPAPTTASEPTPAPNPVEEPKPADPAPVAAAARPPLNVPLVESLPPAQREPFENIRLDAHVYADDPAERFVLIQMRGHRVGDSVGTDGPVIEAITSEGAVLLSGAVRALIPHP